MSVHFSSATDLWATPQATFDELDAEFGFDLDVCATPDNAKCDLFFTKEIDGLTQNWGSATCFMNPPYGRAIKAWMRKAYESSLGGATVVCVVPARTDTVWWHDYAINGEIRFIRGRLQFGTSGKDAPFPCAIIVFRPRAIRGGGMTRDSRSKPVRAETEGLGSRERRCEAIAQTQPPTQGNPMTHITDEQIEAVAKAIGEDERSRCGGTPFDGEDGRFNPWLTDGHMSAARAAITALQSAAPEGGVSSALREALEQISAAPVYVSRDGGRLCDAEDTRDIARAALPPQEVPPACPIKPDSGASMQQRVARAILPHLRHHSMDHALSVARKALADETITAADMDTMDDLAFSPAKSWREEADAHHAELVRLFREAIPFVAAMKTVNSAVLVGEMREALAKIGDHRDDLPRPTNPPRPYPDREIA